MPKCDSCGTTILWGGKKAGQYRYCNDKCQQNGAIIREAGQIPYEQVRRKALEIQMGFCPICKGRGPVEVHMIYKCWTFGHFGKNTIIPRISCKKCGVKGQIGGVIYTLFLGWWSPAGLIITPVLIVRNIIGITYNPVYNGPSKQLEKQVGLLLAEQHHYSIAADNST